MPKNENGTYTSIQMYNIAHSFLLAANRCDEPRIQDIGYVQMLIVPVVVNAAFSCELSIKAILNQCNISVPRNKDAHRIDTLFHILPIELQNKIADEMNRFNFDLDLQSISNVFVEWRYLFEKDVASLPFDFLMTMANVLCSEAEQLIASSAD